MANCKYCGITTPGKQTVCQTCQKYLKSGGVFHPLPKSGEVSYDDGKVICHICGMAFTKLMEHVKRKHHMTEKEYRQEFGLMATARLTSQEYHDKMSKNAKVHPTYKDNFQPTWNGEKRCVSSRKGKKQSLQEINMRREDQRRKGRLSKTKITPERMEELKKIWSKNLKPKSKED